MNAHMVLDLIKPWENVLLVDINALPVMAKMGVLLVKMGIFHQL